MIRKPVHEIGQADLQALLDDKVPEGKTIEYKRELPGGADSDKAKFSAAVSSFANTAGGDLLLGVEESEGLPTTLCGVGPANVDKEKLRLEQVAASGLEPRLPRLDIQPVPLEGGSHVVVVRVPKSWVSPHRVRQNGRFYGRNSAGRYELDVGELRTAFTLSETVAERIRNFRAERVAKIYGDEMPVPMAEGARLILHVLPLSAFAEVPGVDLTNYYYGSERLPLIAPEDSLSTRINLDGVVTYAGSGDGSATAYTQLFRSGAVEAVRPISINTQGLLLLRSYGYEECILRAFPELTNKLQGLGVGPPLYVFLALVGVSGCEIAVGDEFHTHNAPVPLEENVLVLPEVVVEQEEVEPHTALRPIFDMVWNAFGLPRSLNYDGDGNWKLRG